MQSFVGTGKKITRDDVLKAAEFLGVSEAHIRAVMEVEARNSGFDSKKRPTILFEPHIFYKYVVKSRKSEAIKLGVAYPHQGMKPYPRTADGVWKQFDIAYKIDPIAALMSTSWGLGQVMGFNYTSAGFNNVEAMVRTFMQSEGEQLLGMIKFIKANKLDTFLRSNNWTAFARGYNGKGYKKNKYDTKLADSFQRWSKKRPSSGEEKIGVVQDQKVVAKKGRILKVGSRGEDVIELQQLLTDKGYIVKVDEIFGNRTRDAVLAWRADNSLPLKAQMSPEDVQKLRDSPVRPIAVERSEATVKDLIKDGSTIAKSADTLKKLGTGGTILVGGAEIAERTGVTQQLESHLESAEKIASGAERGVSVLDTITSFGASAAQFVIANKTLVALACFGTVAFLSYRILKSWLKDYRTGRTV